MNENSVKYFLSLSFLIFFASLASIDVDANGQVSEELICDEGKEIVFKPSDGSPICVKSSSVENFVKRGYTVPVLAQEPLRIGLLFSTTGDYSTIGKESHVVILSPFRF